MATPFLDVIRAAFDEGTQVAEAGARPRAQQHAAVLVEEVRAALPQVLLVGLNALAARSALQRLFRVVAAYDAEGLERTAAEIYDDAGALRNDLDLLLALRASPDLARELLEMQTYVQRAAVEEAEPPIAAAELAVDRRLVLERLSLAVALNAPHQIEELRANFEVFRRRYAEVYRTHHRDYYAATRALQAEIEREGSALTALRLLNGVEQLGAPLGLDLAERREALWGETESCDVVEPALRAVLHAEALCPTCDLQLSAAPPVDAVRRWRAGLRDALAAQQSRLAGAIVARAIADHDRPAFERLLQALQASHIGPLVDVMSAEVAALIRDVLTAEDGPPEPS